MQNVPGRHKGFHGVNLLLAVADAGLGAVWCGICPSEDRVQAFRKLLRVPANRNRICVTDPLGNSRQTGYDSLGHPRKVQDPRGNTAYFNYNATSGFLVSGVDPNNNAAYFGYDSWRNVTKSVSPRWRETGAYSNFAAYFAYNTLDLRTKAQDALGNVTYFGYSVRGDLSKACNARGTTAYFAYNGLRLKTMRAITDASGNPVTSAQYRYDTYMNRTAAVDGVGNPTYYRYDVLDRLNARRDALLNSSYFKYDAVSNLTAVRDANLNTGYFVYDGLNRMKQAFDPLNNRTYFRYDLAGNRTAVQDPRNNATYYAYDPLDRARCVTDPAGGKTYFAYDAAGNLHALCDPRLNTAYYRYDGLNRRTCVTDPLSRKTYFRYDAAGNLTAQTDALSNVAYFRCDAVNRPRCMVDPLNGRTYFRYDAVGNRTAGLDALSHATYFRYDALNRQTSVTDADNNVTYFGYDAVGNRTKVMNPLLKTAYFNYDALNRLACATDPLNERTYFRYDAVGNVVKVRDARWNATYYRYDALNRRNCTRDALGRTEYFGYDAASNLLKRQDAASATAYFSYDALNRRTEKKYADGSYGYFRYDAVSNRTGACDARGWTYFGYDALNRLASEVQPGAVSLYHRYDAVGNRIALNTAAGTSYYQYDALRRMTSAISGQPALGYGTQAYGTTAYGGAAGQIQATSYTYDATSRRTKTLLGNGCATYYSYDAANRLTSQKSILPGGAALVYFNYGYDAASRIVKIGREAGKTIYYSYDNADRLTGENWYNSGMQNVYAFQWSYDAVGNRHWQNRLGQQSYFSYDAANELNKSAVVGGSATYYSYDPNGNCAKISAANGSTYFAYNSVNLMSRATFRNGVSNYFYYDALNRRRAIKESTGASYFAYDKDGLCLLVERNAAGSVTGAYTRGSAPVNGIGDLVVSQINTPTTTYYQYPVYDRGNVQRTVNAAGAVTGSFEYNAWGEKLLNQPPVEGTRFGFSAPAWITLKDDPDSSTLLPPTRGYYAGAGRFLQRDPRKRLAGGYLYARGNPPVLVDANGAVPGPAAPSLSPLPSPQDVDAWMQLLMPLASPGTGQNGQQTALGGGGVPCASGSTSEGGGPVKGQHSYNVLFFDGVPVGNPPQIYPLRPQALAWEEDLLIQVLKLTVPTFWTAVNPLTLMGGPDTDYIKPPDTLYDYQGDIYTGREINYLGIGMSEAWRGRTLWQAECDTVVWQSVWTVLPPWASGASIPPSAGTLYWLRKGYNDMQDVLERSGKSAGF